jgi:hypothetical protein
VSDRRCEVGCRRLWLIACVIISNLIGSIKINQINITPHATMLKITAEEIHFIIY